MADSNKNYLLDFRRTDYITVNDILLFLTDNTNNVDSNKTICYYQLSL